MTRHTDSASATGTDESSVAALAADVARRVRVQPDFPVPGIAFQDLCPVFADQSLLTRTADAIVQRFAGRFDGVLAVEARGFVLGTAVAQRSGRALILARKPGKLPGAVHSVTYELEYGSAALEVQHDACAFARRLLVVDDVLATGGTVAAAAKLVGLAGGQVAGCAWVLAIAGLRGTDRLASFDNFALLHV